MLATRVLTSTRAMCLTISSSNFGATTSSTNCVKMSRMEMEMPQKWSAAS